MWSKMKNSEGASTTLPKKMGALGLMRAAVFPIYGSKDIVRFLCLGGIKFFVIFCLTLTRDLKDTLVVTSCHLCRFHVDESRVTEAQSIGCPPASACSSSFDLSGVSPVVLRIVMKSDLPEDTKKSLLQVIELQSIIETLMFCCTVIILCVHS